MLEEQWVEADAPEDVVDSDTEDTDLDTSDDITSEEDTSEEDTAEDGMTADSEEDSATFEDSEDASTRAPEGTDSSPESESDTCEGNDCNDATSIDAKVDQDEANEAQEDAAEEDSDAAEEAETPALSTGEKSGCQTQNSGFPPDGMTLLIFLLGYSFSRRNALELFTECNTQFLTRLNLFANSHCKHHMSQFLPRSSPSTPRGSRSSSAMTSAAFANSARSSFSAIFRMADAFTMPLQNAPQRTLERLPLLPWTCPLQIHRLCKQPWEIINLNSLPGFGLSHH